MGLVAPQLKNIAPEVCPSCWPAVFPSALPRSAQHAKMPRFQDGEWFASDLWLNGFMKHDPASLAPASLYVCIKL